MVQNIKCFNIKLLIDNENNHYLKHFAQILYIFLIIRMLEHTKATSEYHVMIISGQIVMNDIILLTPA